MKNFDFCKGVVHVIKKGDTLYSVSKKYNVPLALIMRANPYVDVYNLQVGDEICVPTTNMGGIGNIGTNLCKELCENLKPDYSNPSNPSKPNKGQNSLITYIIRDSESLRDLLDKFDIDLEDLLSNNNMAAIMLKPGMALNIPDKRMVEEDEDTMR